MATVKEIREEIGFNSELAGLLDVMKNTAVFQFRALQRRRARFVRFTQLLTDFFRLVDPAQAPSLFLRPKTEKAAVVIVTSDEGFMGGLNFQVVNAAITHAKARDAEILIVGEKGVWYLKEMARPFTAFKGAADVVERYKLALAIREHIVEGIKAGRFGRVFISYPNPVSFMVQKVEVIEALPTASSFFEEAGKDIKREEVIIESPIEGIMEYLVEEVMLQKLMAVLEDSKLSEFAARAIHLEKSGQGLAEKRKLLNFQYFHAYHEVIDKNTRELFSSQIILRKKQ